DRAVRVLDGQLANALKHAVDFVQGTFRGLHHGDGVLSVPAGLVEAADPRPKLLAEGETGRVVGSAVDAQAARQLLDGLAELQPRHVEVALSVQRLDVGVDPNTHLRSGLLALDTGRRLPAT